MLPSHFCVAAYGSPLSVALQGEFAVRIVHPTNPTPIRSGLFVTYLLHAPGVTAPAELGFDLALVAVCLLEVSGHPCKRKRDTGGGVRGTARLLPKFCETFCWGLDKGGVSQAPLYIFLFRVDWPIIEEGTRQPVKSASNTTTFRCHGDVF